MVDSDVLHRNVVKWSCPHPMKRGFLFQTAHLEDAKYPLPLLGWVVEYLVSKKKRSGGQHPWTRYGRWLWKVTWVIMPYVRGRLHNLKQMTKAYVVNFVCATPNRLGVLFSRRDSNTKERRECRKTLSDCSIPCTKKLYRLNSVAAWEGIFPEGVTLTCYSGNMFTVSKLVLTTAHQDMALSKVQPPSSDWADVPTKCLEAIYIHWHQHIKSSTRELSSKFFLGKNFTRQVVGLTGGCEGCPCQLHTGRVEKCITREPCSESVEGNGRDITQCERIQ